MNLIHRARVALMLQNGNMIWVTGPSWESLVGGTGSSSITRPIRTIHSFKTDRYISLRGQTIPQQIQAIVLTLLEGSFLLQQESHQRDSRLLDGTCQHMGTWRYEQSCPMHRVLGRLSGCWVKTGSGQPKARLISLSGPQSTSIRRPCRLHFIIQKTLVIHRLKLSTF